MKLPALLLSIGVAAAQIPAPTPAPTPAKDRMVIVISLDGFPAYALEDPKLPIPTLRQLAQSGASGRMTGVNPTVTWPNHTAMVTGVRSDKTGLLANGTIVKTNSWPPVKVDPMLDKTVMVHVPTVYDAAHAAGLTTAQVDWVAINNAPSITWNFNEWATPDGPLEKQMLAKKVVTGTDLTNFSKSNILFRDQIWTTAAEFLIKEHRPNLLLVHFLTLDSTHHTYGPGTLAASDAIAFLDGCVARIVNAVNAAGMREKTTFLIVSDHGFKKYTKVVRVPNVENKVYILPEGGSAYVYLTDPADAAATIQSLLSRNIEGLDKIIEPKDFAALGLAKPEQDPQMFHLLLTAKPGYSFAASTGGPVTAAAPQIGGSHGYLASDPDMDPIFIASGYGVGPGAKLAAIQNIDVASTIAALLGVQLPTAIGKPIPVK